MRTARIVYEFGPVFGTFGGAYFARLYGIENAVCFDVGGATTKAGIVRAAEVVQHRGGNLLEIAVETSFPMVRSAVLAGGSVARVSSVDSLSLGPDRMGAAPGPACYGLGGGEATVTGATRRNFERRSIVVRINVSRSTE